MKAIDLIERALSALADSDETVWTAFELLEYLSQGQVEVVRVKPDANVVRATVTLIAGQQQDLPADGLLLIDVVRSLGITGLTESDSITAVERQVMDRTAPGWQKQTPSRGIVHYMYDPRDPKHYDVYPPQPQGPGQADIVYAARPAALTELDDELTLDSEYHGALHDYMLFRAHWMATSAADPNKAMAYRSAFYQALGAQEQAEVAYQAGRFASRDLR
ncbi:MAG: hypothetical protein L0H83_03470 [Salinisphaera sp.]|nr:hypothetical protein [Salinisphaera sp.]